MPQAGSFTDLDAHRQGLFPARPLVRVIKMWQQENAWMDIEVRDKRAKGDGYGLDGTLSELGHAVGIDKSTLRKVVMYEKDWIEFDNADRLVCFIDPMLWHTDPELSELYREYNFANLDLSRPTHPDADPLKTVESLSNWDAARKLGVAKCTIAQLRTQRSETRWEPSRRGHKEMAA